MLCLQENPAFFTIVVALVKVETTLLLRDALDPEAVIPSSWQSTGRGKESEDQPSSSAAEVKSLPKEVIGLHKGSKTICIRFYDLRLNPASHDAMLLKLLLLLVAVHLASLLSEGSLNNQLCWPILSEDTWSYLDNPQFIKEAQFLQVENTQALAADSDAALEAGNTPLEDHIAQDSPLQRMARDTRRIDSMQEGSASKTGKKPSATLCQPIDPLSAPTAGLMVA